MTAPRGESVRHRSALLMVLFPLLSGCATLQVPAGVPALSPCSAPFASSHGVLVCAKAIEGVTDYQQLFEDNLPEIGIAAVWVVVRNPQPSGIDLSKSRWELDLGNRNIAAIDTDEIFKLYYKRRRIRLYSQYADSKARSELRRISLQKGQIPPDEERAGFVFFTINSTPTAVWARGGQIRLHNIILPAKAKADIQLPLTYANP